METSGVYEQRRPKIKTDPNLGYMIEVYGDSYTRAVTSGALVFPCKAQLQPMFQDKMRYDAAYKPGDPLVFSIGTENKTMEAQETHNEYEIGVKLSDTYKYPQFPYYPEEHAFINGPNYEKVADALIETCYKHDLIAGASKLQQGHNVLWNIYFKDNSTMLLSDMQTMLVLQGVLKGYKRLVEVDADLRPALEEKLEIKRQNFWKKAPSSGGFLAPQEGVPPSVRKAPSSMNRTKKKGQPAGMPKLPQHALDLLNEFRAIAPPVAEMDIDDILDDKPVPNNLSSDAFSDDDISDLLDL